MKIIKVLYKGIEYDVEVKFSAGDSIFLTDYLNGENDDYAFAIASILKKHIIEPSAESISPTILCKKQEILKIYINGILAENTELQTLYEKYAGRKAKEIQRLRQDAGRMREEARQDDSRKESGNRQTEKGAKKGLTKSQPLKIF